MRTMFAVMLLTILAINWAGGAQTMGPSVVDLARRDLASRLNVPVSQVELVNQTAVTWPDACLGLRSPGFVCAQVLTPGYVLSFRVNGRTHIYNASQIEAILVGP